MNHRAVVSAFAVTLVLSATAGLAATTRETFDARVTGARRHMRAACQAVQQIARASADQRAIAAGEYRTAFLACAHACTWLTMMHEVNGVTLPVDAVAGAARRGDDLTAPVADLAVLVERVYETSL